MLGTTPPGLLGRHGERSPIEVLSVGEGAGRGDPIDLWFEFLRPYFRFGRVSAPVVELQCVRMH